METLLLPEINAKKVTEFLVSFIKNYLTNAGFRNVIVGLSGGVDSSVVAALCRQALGQEKVFGAILPYSTTPPEAVAHARLIVKQLETTYIQIDITGSIDGYFAHFPEADNLRKGNKIGRERMSILYDLSAHFKALVAGTSNKSERYMGYGTLFGDLACAFNPIGDLYKTQVYQLAGYLEIPDMILKKPASAELWPGQEDEKELGLTYKEIDRTLYYLLDKKLSPEEIINRGVKKEILQKIRQKISQSEFKRQLPQIAVIPDDIKYGIV